MKFNKYIFKTFIAICLIVSGIATFLPFHSKDTPVSSFDAYKFLLFMVCLNIIFTLLNKYLKPYVFLSAIALVIGIYVVYQDKGMRFNYIEIIASSIFIILLIFLLIAKVKWNIVLLLNCIYIFQLTQWIVIANIDFQRSFWPNKFTDAMDMKFHDWSNIWNGSGIGYKLINLVIIIAIITNIVTIILELLKKRLNKKTEIAN